MQNVQGNEMMHVSGMSVADRDTWRVDLVKDTSVMHISCTDQPIPAEKNSKGCILQRQFLGSANQIVGLEYAT